MKRTTAQWRRDVFRSTDPRMTGSVKVLCLYLADHMSGERHVSLPRDVIADALGVHPQRVAERLKKAIEAQYLLRIRAGKTGWTAEFQGCWPEVQTGRRPRHGGPIRTAPQDAERTAPQDAGRNTPGAVRTFEAHPTNGEGVRTAPLDANKESGQPAGFETTGRPDDKSATEDSDPWQLPDTYGEREATG